MKKHTIISTISLCLIVLLWGCYKEDDLNNTINPSSKKTSTLTTLFNAIAPPMQSFTIQAGQEQVITGEKGTSVTFYPNSFKKQNGEILNSGQVNIVLQEMLTGPEMILAGKSTTSNGQLLQSGGQAYINAGLQGENLLINVDNKPIMQIPENNNGTMNLFIGEITENDSIIGDSSINWVEQKDSVQIRQDTTSQNPYYSFGFEEFGYYNCDRFYSQTGSKTEISVKVPQGFNNSNMHVYIYFKSINSVVRCEDFDKLTNIFSISHGMAPVGMNVTIVIVGEKDGQHYLEVKPNITITQDYETDANPTVSSESAIKQAIESL